mgnify:CR=1 FL=1
MLRKLLLEGGEGGDHMMHPYENLSSTLGDLIEILELAVNNFPGIDVTEKLDGQNLLVSYDPSSQHALGIRIKAHTKLGGIDKDAMRNYFTVDREEKHFKRMLKKLQKTRYEELRDEFQEQGTSKTRAARLAKIEMQDREKKGLDPHGITKAEYVDIKEKAKKMRLDATPEGAGVVQAFYDAMRNFEQVAAGMPADYFVDDEGCRSFYNCEVMDPRSPNVVDYDQQTLVIHYVNHTKVCPGGKSERFSKSEAYKKSQMLDKALRMQQSTSDSAEGSKTPSVIVNAIVNFKNVAIDRDYYTLAKTKLENLFSRYGLGDGDQLIKFIAASMEERILRIIPELANSPILGKITDEAVNRARNPGYTPSMAKVGEIIAPLGDESVKQSIKDVLLDREAMSDLVKQAIHPIEMIVHNFAVAVLQGFQSLYIANNAAAADRLKNKMTSHIQKIRGTQDEGGWSSSFIDEKNLTAIKKQLRKMSTAEDREDLDLVFNDEELIAAINNISTAVEGLVFDHNGHTYKFTGQFAPINQMLGIGRFSRSGSGKRDVEMFFEKYDEDSDQEPSEEELLDFDSEGRKIAIMPGGFKPPHMGHYMAAKALWKRSRPDFMIILVGNKSRSESAGETTVEIDDQMSKKIWDLYFNSDPEMDVSKIQVLAPGVSPIKWMYDSMSDVDDSDPMKFHKGDTIITAKGEKDQDDPRFSGMERAGQQSGIGFQSITVPMFGSGISGTEMRKMICRGDDRIIEFFPDHIVTRGPVDENKPELGSKTVVRNSKVAKEIWNLMTSASECDFGGAVAPTPLYETLYNLVKERLLQEKRWQGTVKNPGIAQTRTKKAHSTLLDDGGQKNTPPFTKKRGGWPNSNVFRALGEMQKNGRSIRIILKPPGEYDSAGQIHHEPHSIVKEPIDEENLEETSAVAAGLGGHVNGAWGPPNETNVFEDSEGEDYLKKGEKK